MNFINQALYNLYYIFYTRLPTAYKQFNLLSNVHFTLTLDNVMYYN
jgi:hypothetical protein